MMTSLARAILIQKSAFTKMSTFHVKLGVQRKLREVQRPMQSNCKSNGRLSYLPHNRISELIIK